MENEKKSYHYKTVVIRFDNEGGDIPGYGRGHWYINELRQVGQRCKTAKIYFHTINLAKQYIDGWDD